MLSKHNSRIQTLGNVWDRLSAVPHTSVCGLHLAVISEAMLRLASLLRTDHMLGGTQSSTFITQLNLAAQEITDELALDEG